MFVGKESVGNRKLMNLQKDDEFAWYTKLESQGSGWNSQGCELRLEEEKNLLLFWVLLFSPWASMVDQMVRNLPTT